MVSYSKLYKVLFTTLKLFAILQSLVTRAEEASILTNAAVGGDVNANNCSDP